MRTVNFRDAILYGIAYRKGMDPRTDLLTVEIYSYVTYINLWVAKFWDKLDFPEWTVTERRSPDANHLVLYDERLATPMGKVLKVYLLDPKTTRGPVDTPFRLADKGVHCGFDHGTYAWIKFMLRPPIFTGVPFDRTKTYTTGDLIYDPVTGECFIAGVAQAPPVDDGGQLKLMVGLPTVTDAVTTNASTTLTSATAIFSKQDEGAFVNGTGIPDKTTIASVTNSTTAVMSTAATATATGVTVTIGPRLEQALNDMVSVSTGVTINADPTLVIASGAFSAKDIGAVISSDKYPKGTYIKSVTNATTVVLSQNALASSSTAAIIIGAPGSRWQKVPFPFQLAEPVIRGVYADVQRSEEQTDKAQLEEQGAAAALNERGEAQVGGDFDLLTDQVRPPRRYQGASAR